VPGRSRNFKHEVLKAFKVRPAPWLHANALRDPL
jgi:hypothetical protein